MQTYNLIDCFLAKMAVIGGINTVKIAYNHGSTDLSVFHNIGTCELRQIENDSMDELLKHYLVWYKPNKFGLSGWNIAGSANYRLCEYMNGLKNSSIKMPTDVSSLVESFKQGLQKPIEILVAYDTAHKISLIVDGTKRAIALCYIKHKEPTNMKRLINSTHPIRILQLNSAYSGGLFPCDFLKLYLKTEED